jgi:hypothetical protein
MSANRTSPAGVFASPLQHGVQDLVIFAEADTSSAAQQLKPRPLITELKEEVNADMRNWVHPLSLHGSLNRGSLTSGQGQVPYVSF